MQGLIPILQLIIAISVLIILHEIGHFAACRLFKQDVDEFGIGFPPRALRLWRQQGTIKIGSTTVITPRGHRILLDIEKGMWVDAITERRSDEQYYLEKISVLNPETADLELKREQVEDKVHFRGEITETRMGTLYSLNWLPLGGFVKPKGEGDPSVPDGLAVASPWVRIGVFAAGPLANFIIGILLYAFIVMQVGMPAHVYVAEVSQDSPAAAAGVLVDDVILTVNGQEVTTSNEVRQIIYDNLGQPLEMTLERGTQTLTTSMVPRNPPPEDGAIGILMDHIVEPVSLWRAIPLGAQATYNQAMLIFTIPSEIIRGALSPEMARPVGYKGMYDMYQYVRAEDPLPQTAVNVNVIGFFAMISVSLGVFNLLPIPALDGGRILFALPEIIFRRRIPIEWQNAVNFVFFMGLILLFFYINILDFTNPIQLP